jgi:multidrug efflux pump subunit AcrA (membrane-fusion protein)
MKSGGKKSVKKKIMMITACVVIVALMGYAVYYVAKSNSKEAELKPDGIIQVDRGDLISTYTSSATVESGRQGNFAILDGTKVTGVNVRVGDMVKKGDVLATFDASSLDSMLALKKRDYENAKKSYQEYQKSAAEAPKQSAALKKQIAELEKKVAQLQKESEAETASAAATTSAAGNAQLDELKASIAGLLGNTRLASLLVDRVFASNGSVAQTLSAFQNLLGGSLMMNSSSLQSMMSSMGMGSTELVSASLELVQLKVQDSVLSMQVGGSLESVYKSVSDSAEAAYLQAQATVSQLKKNWVAETDGIIRDVGIAAGEVYHDRAASNPASSINVTSLLASLSTGNADITSLLSGLFSNSPSGMVVEYYPFTATFLLGKYDIAKVALDQSVKVTSVSGQEFDAIVSYISPVAKESSDINISSLMGSSGSAKGVEARITIPQPDKSITIGLDVEVSIELEKKSNVLRVPIQSVQISEGNEGYYVFLYDRDTKTIHKQMVKTGLFDGNAYYEITEGLKEGQEIIQAPVKTMKDGDKVKLAANG